MDTPRLSPRELDSWARFASVLELLSSALDTQLRRDAGLTHFDYRVLSMLSEAEEQTLRMTFLAQTTNATLPRLSHVVQRLEAKGYVERSPCAEDRRATNARLTETGWQKVQEAAPGHAETVRQYVIDALDGEQVEALGVIADQILGRLDPSGDMRPAYQQREGAGRRIGDE